MSELFAALDLDDEGKLVGRTPTLLLLLLLLKLCVLDLVPLVPRSRAHGWVYVCVCVCERCGLAKPQSGDEFKAVASQVYPSADDDDIE